MNNGIKIEIHRATAKGDFATLLYPHKAHFRDHEFIVPRGFEFDGASVPRLLQPLICSPLGPESARASCKHDFIYRTQPPGWTRKEADLMFLCDLLEDGLPPNRAFWAYRGVRLGGWRAWNKNRKILEEWRGPVE